MAVRINNTENIRKANRWSEQDDAALCLLLKRKIKDVSLAMKEAPSPYERSHLKETKKHYKQMLAKVEDGSYNGDIIFAELQAAQELRGRQAAAVAGYSTIAGAKKYVNSYMDMDFDYESAFRKTRYYGVALPIILLLLSIAFLGIFVMGAFLPNSLVTSVDDDYGIALDTFFYYKLGSGVNDIVIDNTGNWPAGLYKSKTPVEGTKFVNSMGQEPDTVALFADLGMTAIYITPFDIVKAWFRTPMLESTRIDFLEDSPYFSGDSYYYVCLFYGSKGTALNTFRTENGDIDVSVVIRYIGVYGTIAFVILSFLFGIISIITNIVRIFTYTSRKSHGNSILCFVFSLLAMIGPALATVEGTDIGASFSNYFLALTNMKSFLAEPESAAGIGLLFFIPAGLALVSMVLPHLFRNRLKKRETFVPKGNRNRSPLNDPYYVDESTLRRLT